MHAIAAVPLFLIHETNLNATPKGLVHAEWKDHNDDVGLPSGPGMEGQSTAGSRMARSPIID
jgi:hypothetical protein